MDVNPIIDPQRKHVVSFDSAKKLTAEMLMDYVKPENATISRCIPRFKERFVT